METARRGSEHFGAPEPVVPDANRTGRLVARRRGGVGDAEHLPVRRGWRCPAPATSGSVEDDAVDTTIFVAPSLIFRSSGPDPCS